MIASTTFDRASASLGEALPRLGGALLLLVAGLFVAWLLGRLAARALGVVGLDGLAERLGIHDVLERIGLQRSLTHLVGRAVRITLSIVVIMASLSLLGLAALSQSLNEAVLFVPKLLVALALVLTGVIVADLVRDRVERIATQMAVGAPLGRLAQLVVLAIFILTALAQLSISTGILTALVGITFLAAVLTVALAFGLGSREVAREISAGRYVGTSFEIGQTISLDGAVRGEIVALESAATVLRDDEGLTVRVPNHLLVESIVTVHTPPEQASPTA
jgi:small-conductance mechanosensitive channel